MPNQFSHPSDEWSGTHSLLFILRPTEQVARRIAAGARHERTIHGLRGIPVGPERLHMTMFCIGQYEGNVPADVVARASSAAEAISAAPFDVTLDRLLSFRHPPDKRPLVLRGSDGLPRVQEFHQRLGAALAKADLKGFGGSRITPHVTLLWDSRNIPERQINPIRWTVQEFSLVDSLIGKSRHIQLGKWTLKRGLHRPAGCRAQLKWP
jgi:2'-5' RNA ligase